MKKAFENNQAESGIRERIRTLIDKITLTAANNALGLKIDLYGNIAALFALANEDKNNMNNQKQERPTSNDVAFLDNDGCGRAQHSGYTDNNFRCNWTIQSN